jgi:hypothetical protein
VEDTTFATFVVGAVFGCAAWYVLRHKLGSDEDILAAIWRPSRIVGRIIKIVSIVFLPILAYLLLILLEVPGIPRLGYLHDLATREPIGYLLLGFLFGVLLGEWLSYIFIPPQLRTDELRDAHTRWGYFLVAIIALGLLYPALVPALRSLKGGDVKTEFFSLSFAAKEPEKGANITGTSEFTASQLKDPDRPLGELPFFESIAERDTEYAELFLKQDEVFRKTLQSAEGRDAAQSLLDYEITPIHRSDKPFIKLMQKLGECLYDHWKLFHSVDMISQQIRPILPIYTGLVQGKNNRLGLLKKAIIKASQGLASDIILAKSNLPADQIDETKHIDQIERRIVSAYQSDTHCPTTDDGDAVQEIRLELPYAAFALAHLFYDEGDHKQAARVVADWLDAEYHLEDCNKTGTWPCPALDEYPGDKSQYPVGYQVSEKRKPLPIWYRIRMEYELGVTLEGTDSTRSIVDAYKRLEASYTELFAESSIQSASKWMDHCGEQDQHDPRKARLVLAFLSTVNTRIQYQAAMVDGGLIPAAEVMTDQEREDGKLLTNTKFGCFYEPLVSQQDKEDYEGSFYAQYGTVLALSAKGEDASQELGRAEQKHWLIEARPQLEKAVETLKLRAEHERNKRYTKPLRDQLFYLGPSQDILRATQERLDRVSQTLR